MVLESLCAAYGKRNVLGILHSLLNPLKCSPNSCHQAIAQLCKQGKLQGILTTNFDTLIERALNNEAVAYHVITPNRINHDDTIPVVKAHGTIDDPDSLVFTRGDYYLGIHEDIREMLKSNMMGSTVVIAGYSGNDIDVFPLMRSFLENKILNQVHVVNRVPLDENLHYKEIENLIEYHHEVAEDFLCRSAKISLPSGSYYHQNHISAIVPSREKFPAALFFGDCLLKLGLKKDLAFRIFFLTQDIVEDETGDMRQLCISKFAKSHALFDIYDNSWGETEYSAGRTLLHRILKNSNLSERKEFLSEFGRSLASLELEGDVKRVYSSSSYMSGRVMPRGAERFGDTPQDIEFLHNVLSWELRARIRACFSALAFAASVDSSDQRQQAMLTVAEKLMYGFEKWETYFTDSRTSDELPILPIFYAKYFRVIRSCIIKSNKGLLEDLNTCISLSKRHGFYLGTSHCYFLKKKYGIGLLENEKDDFESIQKYCGINEKNMIAPFYQAGKEPFVLSINTFKPP